MKVLRLTRRPGSLAVVTAALLLAACNPLDLGHNTVTLEVDSEDGSAVRLITSYDFSIYYEQTGQEQFVLSDADTTWVDTPFSHDYELSRTGRFYARAMEAENPQASVSLRALVDGNEIFFRDVVLTGDGTQFYYRQR